MRTPRGGTSVHAAEQRRRSPNRVRSLSAESLRFNHRKPWTSLTGQREARTSMPRSTRAASPSLVGLTRIPGPVADAPQRFLPNALAMQ